MYKNEVTYKITLTTDLANWEKKGFEFHTPPSSVYRVGAKAKAYQAAVRGSVVLRTVHIK